VLRIRSAQIRIILECRNRISNIILGRLIRIRIEVKSRIRIRIRTKVKIGIRIEVKNQELGGLEKISRSGCMYKKEKSQERPTLEPRMLNLNPDPHQSEKLDPDPHHCF
jgi:hypothetical protein